MNRADFTQKRNPSNPAGRAVIGFHAIREAIKMHPKALEALWLKKGWESSKDLREIKEAARCKFEVKPDAVLDRFGSHQDAVLFVTKTPEIDWEKIYAAERATLVLLDGIEDPHNLGAILRTSWLMGVDGLLRPHDRSVGLTPSVHKVACGGVEHVPTETFANFSAVLEQLKAKGFWVFGLSHEGPRDLYQMKIPEKVVWAVGAEGKGLRTTTAKLCDELVRIPQASDAASYNASVSAAFALGESFRQNRR